MEVVRELSQGKQPDGISQSGEMAGTQGVPALSLTAPQIVVRIENRTAFSDTELKGMSIDELKRVVGELAPQYRASLKAVGLDGANVDAQMDAMVSSQDAAELVKSADVMQKELGFGEGFDSDSDGLQSNFEDDIMKKESEQEKQAKKTLLTKIQYHPWTLQLKTDDKNMLSGIFQKATSRFRTFPTRGNTDF